MKPHLGRRAASEWEHAGSIDGPLHPGAASFRRRMIAVVAVGVILLGGISIALAWRQYDHAKVTATNDLEARVVGVSAVVDTSFGGQITTLDSIAKTPSVVGEQLPRMNAYFQRVNPPSAMLFSGGLGWLDRTGHARASSAAGGPSFADLSGRTYFQQVMKTGKPYVSAGLIAHNNKQPIIVVAVPTFDQRGQLAGVLVGSILLKTVGESKQALDLGYGNLQIVDREGQLLLSGLARVPNKPLLARIEQGGAGVVTNTSGLTGHGGDIVAFATSKTARWVSVIDRPRSAVFGPARRALVLELASVGAGVLFVLLILAFVVWRSRRDTDIQNERARSWSGLTRELLSAATPLEVAEALLGSLAAAFRDAVAIVAVENSDETLVRAASRLPQARRIVESTETLEAIATIGKDGPKSRVLEQEPTLSAIGLESRRRLRALHSLPITDQNSRRVGSISLLTIASRLEASEWALLASFADQAAHALERARIFEHEHDLAVRLQRSLLPDRLPGAPGVELAGHYLAGGDGVEVGGDWYDAVRRPDGIVQLCVGDVSGKGITAATVMGRQRNTFHVYAYDYLSPAEIIRRMLRHAGGDEMITVACISVDPYTGELSYSCAGHPPPILLDRDSGEVVRLDGASAPPIGVAEAADVVEATVQLSEHTVIAMYTDGLIERRGENIDDAITFLGQVIASESSLTPDRIVRRVSAAIGAPDDDVALMVVTLAGERTNFEVEVPAEPTSLPEIRRRLRVWLERRKFDEEQCGDIVLAVSEACNNAIEHGYRDGEGTIRLSVVDEWKTLRVVVEDQGSWREAVQSDERGRGIMLMKHLMHSAEIETGPHGTRVTLERRVRPDLEAAPEYAPTAP